MRLSLPDKPPSRGSFGNDARWENRRQQGQSVHRVDSALPYVGHNEGH